MPGTTAPDAPVVYLAEPAQPIQLTFLPEFNALRAVDWWDNAHFVQTVGKVPARPWRNVRPVYDDVLEWTRTGADHAAGVVPATITNDGLALTVVDVDTGDSRRAGESLPGAGGSADPAGGRATLLLRRRRAAAEWNFPLARLLW